METVSAYWVRQLKVADEPGLISKGSADSSRLGAGTMTVTVTVDDAVPPGPVAVSV